MGSLYSYSEATGGLCPQTKAELSDIRQFSNILSITMTWIHKGGIFCLFMMVGTVSGMEPGPSSISLQTNTSSSQLSTLGSQLVQIQEQVEVLQQENMEDKQRIVHLERRVSLLESVCGSSEMETEISGEEEVTMSTNVRSSSIEISEEEVTMSTNIKSTNVRSSSTEISEEEVTMSTNVISSSIEIRPLIAIGGYDGDSLASAEVVNTSCDFPLPEPRRGHMSVTTTDGKTLVCGGRTESEDYELFTASCLQFDYESKSWKEHSTLLSIRRNGASAVTLSRGTYVLGGVNNAKRSSEILATGSTVWTQGPHIPGDGVWRSCVAKLSDTEFLILGGFYDRTQALFYNEEQGTWRRLPRLTAEVWGHGCVALGDIVLMAGGFSDNYIARRRTVIFDTKTGSSREVASLKYPRAYVDMVLYGGRPVILGGQDDSGNRSDGEMWNMETETWEEADIHLNIARDSYSLMTMAEDIECD